MNYKERYSLNKKRGFKDFSDIKARYTCHFCGACVVVCPTQCLQPATPGNEKIIWEMERCICCSLCFKVCPGREVDYHQLDKRMFPPGKNGYQYDSEMGNFLTNYIGYSQWEDIRRRGSSGGVATTMLLYLLERKEIDGAIVVGFKKEEPWLPETKLYRSRQEIIDASQSKYAIFSHLSILEQIEQEEGRFALVALPCQINGFKKMEPFKPRLKEKIAYIFGVFCGYNMFYEATEFVGKKFGIQKKDIKELRYRNGLWPGGMTFYLKDGSIKSIDDFHYHYLNAVFLPHRCRYCWDFFAQYADLSFGDCWLPELYTDKPEENRGWSSIIVRTPKGDSLVMQAMEDKWIVAREVSKEKVKESFPSMLKYKKRGVFVRMALHPYSPRLVGIRKPKIHLAEYPYHVLYYMVLLIGGSKIFKWVISLFSLPRLRWAITLFKGIMRHPHDARNKVLK